VVEGLVGPGQMHDRSSGEERGCHTAPDIVPLAARHVDSTPHIPGAVLVDTILDMADERAEALEHAPRTQEERDEFADEALRPFRSKHVEESVHTLPTGNEEEVVTEATGSSSSRSNYIMFTGCVSLIWL
jgi:hypothetical protein